MLFLGHLIPIAFQFTHLYSFHRLPTMLPASTIPTTAPIRVAQKAKRQRRPINVFINDCGFPDESDNYDTLPHTIDMGSVLCSLKHDHRLWQSLLWSWLGKSDLSHLDRTMPRMHSSKWNANFGYARHTALVWAQRKATSSLLALNLSELMSVPAETDLTLGISSKRLSSPTHACSNTIINAWQFFECSSLPQGLAMLFANLHATMSPKQSCSLVWLATSSSCNLSPLVLDKLKAMKFGVTHT